MAAERGCGWLQLLDDDTSVTGEFLRGMLRNAAEAAGDERVAAVVPFLYAGSFCMSPRLWRFARHVPLPRPDAAYTETRSIFAANSGTLMRLRALETIGGYSARFWLDYSDIESSTGCTSMDFVSALPAISASNMRWRCWTTIDG